MKSLCYLFLLLSVLGACKSPNSRSSRVSDIGYSSAGNGRYSEVFRLQGNDVVLTTCLYGDDSWNKVDLNHKDACRYNETRIPFELLKGEIINQASGFGNDEGIERYKSSLKSTVNKLTAAVTAYSAELAKVEGQLKATDAQSRQGEIQEQYRFLDAKKKKTQLELDYFAVALSLADNITSSDKITETIILKEITKKLSEEFIYNLKQDANVLFPVNFSYQIWEGPEAGQERNMKAALKSSYAKASESEREKMALEFVAGPSFRNAWINVYSKSRTSFYSPYNTALNRLRSDPNRKVISNGKTFAFGSELIERIENQGVSRSVADGLSRPPELMTTHIRGLSCRDLFGQNARTATRDELLSASQQIKSSKYFPEIIGEYFWTPLTAEGAKLGWGVQGWTSWLQNSRITADETYQVSFSQNGQTESRKVSLSAGAHLICLLQ